MPIESRNDRNDLFAPHWRRPVDLNHASRLVSHGPTVMVSALHDGRRNLMSASWSMPVEFMPPRIAVVLDKSTWTRELAVASGTLALMVPCRASADLAFTVGSIGGKALHDEGSDKFARYGIDSFPGPALGLPLATDCIAWLECRLLREPGVEERYDTFFCEAVSAFADTRVFSAGHWTLDDAPADLHTLHYIAAGSFAVASNSIKASMLPTVSPAGDASRAGP